MEDSLQQEVPIPSDRTKSKKNKRKKIMKEFENRIKNRNHKFISGGKSIQELKLESLVFGGESEFLEHLHADVSVKSRKKKKVELDDSDEDNQIDHGVIEQTVRKKPAWEDEDDKNILVSDKTDTDRNVHRSLLKKGSEKYEEFAREQFQKITGNPRWADLEKKTSTSDSEDDDQVESSGTLLQKTGNFLRKSTSLPAREINIRKCGLLHDEAGVIIKTVEFHRLSRVAVTAGVSGTATLFQIDGKENSKIQSVHFENFPISSAHFNCDGTELIVWSKQFGHFFTYDMIYGKIRKVICEHGMNKKNVKKFYMSPDGQFMVICGLYGNIHLLCSKSKEWIGTLTMNGEVIDIAFNQDGSRMYSCGDGGQVYVWDMESRSCIHRFIDQGCVTGTSIATSPNDQYIACGSDSGVVNIYDSSHVLTNLKPVPLKAIMNLTTQISSLKFNNTSEILAMASYFKKNAVKLVHFPSMTIFCNFPRKDNKFGKVNCLDVSANSGYFMFGNTGGNAYIYRLGHFTNY